MAPKKSQLPVDPNSDVSIDDLLPIIPNAVRNAYQLYGHHYNHDDMDDLAQSIVVLLIKNDGHGLRSFKHLS